MADLGNIRQAIADTVEAAIDGLRVHAIVPDSISPPAFIVLDPKPGGIVYDSAFAGGLHQLELTFALLVGKPSERAAQLLLDQFVSPTGEKSIRVAIRGDKPYGRVGLTDTTVVPKALTAYGEVVFGNVTYLGAHIIATISTR